MVSYLELQKQAAGSNRGPRHLVSFFMHGTPVLNDDELAWIPLRFGCDVEVLELYAVFKTAPTDLTTVVVERCTQTNVDGTPSWQNICTVDLTVDANERSSETASTPPTIDQNILTNKDHLRVRVTGGGTGAEDLTVTVLVQES